MKTKQVILVRRDLKMPTGKLAAQVAHASIAVVLDQGDWKDPKTYTLKDIPVPMFYWLTGSFTKVVLGVDNEEELLYIYRRAKGIIPCSLIKDEGRTVFKEPTYTCVGLGPEESILIDEFAGHLKLY